MGSVLEWFNGSHAGGEAVDGVTEQDGGLAFEAKDLQQHLKDKRECKYRCDAFLFNCIVKLMARNNSELDISEYNEINTTLV